MSHVTHSLDRPVLPISVPDYPRATELHAADAKPPPRFEVKAPDGAPNVIVFLIDDIGFGHPSTFGGAIPMPTLDRVAANGLMYNRFHTTALCSPTRVALLTGRNHHTNNAGAIMEVATAFRGNTGARPQSVTPLAEILRQTVTAPPPSASTTKRRRGKSAYPDHSIAGRRNPGSTSSTASLVARPINGRPDHRRYDQDRGSARSELSLHRRHDEPGDQLDSQPAVADPQQAVLHVLCYRRHARDITFPKSGSQFKGKFDGGWDQYREQTIARQKQLGIIPKTRSWPPIRDQGLGFTLG